MQKSPESCRYHSLGLFLSAIIAYLKLLKCNASTGFSDFNHAKKIPFLYTCIRARATVQLGPKGTS